MLSSQKHNALEGVFEGSCVGDIFDRKCFDLHPRNSFTNNSATETIFNFEFLKQITKAVPPIFFMIFDGVGIPVAKTDFFFFS